jgi:hypothetical protein
MILVIAGGPSVNDYPRGEVEALARRCFTIAVNETGFVFPCDAIASIDPWIISRKWQVLKELRKPLITRGWQFKENQHLDLVQLPGDEPYDRRVVNSFPLSGMMACKIADRLALQFGGKAYVLGMDASIGHFPGHPHPDNKTQYVDEARPLSKYDALNLVRTYNLSVGSKIEAWSKMKDLPDVTEVTNKDEMMSWLRANIKDEIFKGIA